VPAPVPDTLTPNGDGEGDTLPLAYKIVRPSTVTAQLVGPGGATITLETPYPPDPATGAPAPPKPPGMYAFTWDGVDPRTGRPAPEGRWAWRVSATDDRAQVTTQSRQLTFDTTLEGVTVTPSLLRLPPAGAELTVTVRLRYRADAVLRVETPLGSSVRTLTRRELGAGPQSLVWDGRTGGSGKALAQSGRYVAHVIASNQYGTVELEKAFTVRRVAGPKSETKHK